MRNFITRRNLLLIGILALAVFLRLYRLNEVPAGLDEDEVSVGYNAYSLLRTGQMAVDNRGVSLVYTFLTVPLVGIFGLKTWVVRLPSALAGVGTVILVYYLANKLFPEFRNKIFNFPASSAGRQFSIFSCLLIAISPWHIQFSRQVSDANLALFSFTLFLVVILNKRLRFRKIILILAGAGFLMTIIKELLLNFKQSLWLGQETYNWGWTKFTYQIALNFFEYLNTDFLFFTGDTKLLRNGLNGELGLFYFFSLPLFLIGVYHLFAQKMKYRFVISGWIITIFFIAAVNRYTPNARVSFLTVLPIEMINALGLFILVKFIKTKVRRSVIVNGVFVLMMMILAYNFLLYFHLYQHHFYKQTGSQEYYGYLPVNRFISEHWTKYDRIVVSNRYGNADIYSLFYQQIDPQEYFKSKNKVGFGKFIFQDTIDLAGGVKTLWISDQDRRLSNSEPLAEFKLLNKTTVFLAWEL